jgi:hypothetical protein
MTPPFPGANLACGAYRFFAALAVFFFAPAFLAVFFAIV